MSPRLALVLLPLVLLASPVATRPATADPAFKSIHVLGTFNGWDTRLWDTDRGMSRTGTTWRDTIAVFPWYVDRRYQQFKFVTNADWEIPPDYGLCPDRVGEYGRLSGPVCLLKGGLNLQMYADVAGRYRMTLDEATRTYDATLVEPFTARITGTVQSGGVAAEVRVYGAGDTLLLARALSDTSTGAFAVDRLDGRSYDLRVRASGFLERTIAGVGVTPGGTASVGTIVLVEGTPARRSTWGEIKIRYR